MKPHTLILTGFGINSDRELAECFERAGSSTARIHVNDLLENPKLLDAAQVLAFPGGFSFGDHLGSGRVMAVKLKLSLGDALQDFVRKGKPVLGICNGFQVLVKM